MSNLARRLGLRRALRLPRHSDGGGASVPTPADVVGSLEWWNPADASSRVDVGSKCSTLTGQIAAEVFSQGTDASRLVVATARGATCLRASGAQRMPCAFSTVSLAKPFTLWTLCEATGGTGLREPLDSNDGTKRAALRLNASGVWEAFAGALLTSTAAAASTPRLVIMTFNGASSKIWVDDMTATVASGNAGAHAAPPGLTIGDHASVVGGAPWTGEVWDVGIIDGEPSLADRTALAVYAESKITGTMLTY